MNWPLAIAIIVILAITIPFAFFIALGFSDFGDYISEDDNQ